MEEKREWDGWERKREVGETDRVRRGEERERWERKREGGVGKRKRER